MSTICATFSNGFRQSEPFQILPDDDLWVLYNVDQGTLEAEIEEYFLGNGKQWVSLNRGVPLRTVADLARTDARHYSDSQAT